MKNQNEETMWPGHFCDQHYFNNFLIKEYDSDKYFKMKIIDNAIYNVRPWLLKRLIDEKREHHVKVMHARNLEKEDFNLIVRKLKNSS